MKISTTLLPLFLSIVISGCQTIDIRGQYVENDVIDQLENNKLTKSEVEELIGTPTIIPDYTKNTWYYVHRLAARRAWFDPKIIEQKILQIKFSKNDTIEEVKILNDSNRDDIKIVSEYTKSYGTEQNALQTFVRNIGRFNKTTEGKKRKNRK